MDILNKAFALNENALRVRGQRMEVLAANIANADTPNFKARDLDFGEIFKNNLKNLKFFSALIKNFLKSP